MARANAVFRDSYQLLSPPRVIFATQATVSMLLVGGKIAFSRHPSRAGLNLFLSGFQLAPAQSGSVTDTRSKGRFHTLTQASELEGPVLMDLSETAKTVSYQQTFPNIEQTVLCLKLCCNPQDHKQISIFSGLFTHP